MEADKAFSLEAIVGQESVKQFISRWLRADRKPHAMLFVGLPGVGKKTLAMAFAKAILCGRPEGPCDDCLSCRRFNEQSHPDLVHLAPEGLTFKREMIRQLQTEAPFQPRLAATRVAVLERADRMTEEAANSFLKLLEEPVAPWVFLLTADEEQRVLPTIRSRVVRLPVAALTEEAAAQILTARGVEAQAAAVAAELSGGSVGRALLLAQGPALEMQRKIQTLLQALPVKDAARIWQAAPWLEQVKTEEAQLFTLVMMALCREAWLQCSGLKAGTSQLSLTDVCRLARVVETAERDLAVRGNPRLVLEACCIRINAVYKKEEPFCQS